MEFRRIATENHEIFSRAMALYADSFPLHEQRMPLSQKEIMAHPDYRFNLIYEGDTWVGLMLNWETESFIYVEHFCILPQMRNKRCGQRALEALSRQGKGIILEIDPPVDEVSIRRQRFYERSGFKANGFSHVHPPYRQGFSGHSLVVMSHPNPLSRAQYEAFSLYLKDVVMSGV